MVSLGLSKSTIHVSSHNALAWDHFSVEISLHILCCWYRLSLLCKFPLTSLAWKAGPSLVFSHLLVRALSLCPRDLPTRDEDPWIYKHEKLLGGLYLGISEIHPFVALKMAWCELAYFPPEQGPGGQERPTPRIELRREVDTWEKNFRVKQIDQK